MSFVKRRFPPVSLPVAVLCLTLGGCVGGGSKPEPARAQAPVPAKAAAKTTTAEKPAPKETAAPRDDAGKADTSGLPQLVRQDYELAVGALKNEKYAVAERFLAPLVEKYPDLSGPLVNLAIVYFNTGREQQARELFEKAAGLGPNATASNYLGILARKAGDFKAAEKYYRDAIVAEATYANAYLNLGILQDLYLGDLQAALTSYQHYQELTRGSDKTVEKWIVDLKRRM